ncbi:MAG: hypothetical protein ABSH06_05110 [Thermodesulfobacteriota bacterium]|jgi:hypothetical protein
MVSNPPKLEELKELGRKHWKEHLPKLFKGLQESGQLEDSLDQAAKNTLNAYQKAKDHLQKNGYDPNQAHYAAWELVREEWLLRPSEDQPELENPPRNDQFESLLSSTNPPRNLKISE